MKKLSAYIARFAMLCFAFLLTISGTQAVDIAYANDDRLITIEEYEAAMNAEGAKYGIKCDVLAYDPSIQLTQGMLENALRNLKFSAENFKITDIAPSRTMASTRSMPVRSTFYKEFRASCPPFGWADIRVEADVTVDVQNSYVIQVHNTSAYQYGPFMNFDSWETTKIDTKLNVPRAGWTRATVSGRARFSYADPVTGITTGMTYGVSNAEVYIQCW